MPTQPTEAAARPSHLITRDPGRGAPVLVVGGTGALGRKVIASLLARGKPVRALVRPATDAGAIAGPGVTIVRGDMLDPASLEPAFDGVDAIITSAAGYTTHKKGDTTRTDTEGNRNLVDAAKRARVRRFVLTGILNAHLAPEVSHFWHKKRVEDYLEARGVPFVSLRPGAFVDQSVDVYAKMVARGRLFAPGRADARWTYVYTPDLADDLAAAVDAPARDGERVDIGWDRPLSTRELAALAAEVVGARVAARAVPWWLLGSALAAVGLFSETARDLRAMIKFFLSGRYVADTTRQRELFGRVPTAEDAVRRWLRAAPALRPAPPIARPSASLPG
jgi:uncharacterized protein YbjT (DUF2867 family)